MKNKAHNGDIKALAISPDGALVASGSVDDNLKVWRINTLELLHQFEGHTMSIYAAAFAPNGRFVYSGARDAEIRKWSLETGRQVAEPLRFRNAVVGLHFAPDHKTLIAGSLSGELVHINADEFHVTSRLRLESRARLTDLDVSSQGQVVVIQRDGTISLWSKVSQPPSKVVSSRLPKTSLEMVEFAPDGKTACALSNDGKLLIFDASTGEAVGTAITLPPVNGIVRSSAISEATNQYAVASEGRLFIGTIQGKAKEVDIGTGDISALSFTPNGSNLLVGRSNGSVLNIETSDSTIASTQMLHSGAVRHLQFGLSDGSLWSASDDIVISQIDPKTWETKLKITDHTSPIGGLQSIRKGFG